MAAYIKFDGVDGECVDTFKFAKPGESQVEKAGKAESGIIYSDHGSDHHDSAASEEVTLNYNKIEWTYSGDPKGYTEVEWTYDTGFDEFKEVEVHTDAPF